MRIADVFTDMHHEMKKIELLSVLCIYLFVFDKLENVCIDVLLR